MTLYTLDLEFDINQVTRSLQYKFSNPEKKTGVLAGTFNFNNSTGIDDSSMVVSVTATGSLIGEPRVTVHDCTLVSVSNGDLGRSFLSPFDKTSAVAQLKKWAPLEKMDAPDGRVKLYGMASSRLPVVAQDGQWQISGYLSVIIVIDGHTYNRVFTFDPEGTAGAGTGLGWPG